MSDGKTAGAILAGGRARRFGGQDKSRLIVQGRSILERQVELLRTVVDDVFLVGHDSGRFADTGLRVFPDRVSGAGAIGGIFTALESTTVANLCESIAIGCDGRSTSSTAACWGAIWNESTTRRTSCTPRSHAPRTP